MVLTISKSDSQKQVVDPVIGGRYREVTSEGLERSGRRANARATERSGNPEHKTARPPGELVPSKSRETSMRCGVGAGREKPQATRLCCK